MVDCNHCNRDIAEGDDSGEDGEQPYLTHLAEEHTYELTRIDEKRLEKEWDGDLDDVKNRTNGYVDWAIGAGVTVIVFILGVLIVSLL
jgi:hypothetical protein